VRTRWRTQQRHLLLQGEVEQVIAAVRVICRGRNSKAIRTHRHYFIKNQSRSVQCHFPRPRSGLVGREHDRLRFGLEEVWGVGPEFDDLSLSRFLSDMLRL